MSRRTTEEVHEQDGHDTLVQSCELCQEETAEQPDVDELRTTEAEPVETHMTERQGCLVCGRPVHHRGLCATHWASRRGDAVR